MERSLKGEKLVKAFFFSKLLMSVLFSLAGLINLNL